jgi:ketosteroid isomerase-like protein
MSEEVTVAQTSLDLVKAMLAADKTHLTSLLSDQLSYGHQGGVIQSKAAFIDMIVAKKPYKSITITEASTSVVGNNAIVRHVFAAEFESDGNKGAAKIGALEVWVKNDLHWKLLARQGFRT